MSPAGSVPGCNALDAMDIGFFRTDDNNDSKTIGGFVTDAERFTASLNKNGKLLKAYFEGSSFSGEVSP
jgi:hypothetical protein